MSRRSAREGKIHHWQVLKPTLLPGSSPRPRISVPAILRAFNRHLQLQEGAIHEMLRPRTESHTMLQPQQPTRSPRTNHRPRRHRRQQPFSTVPLLQLGPKANRPQPHQNLINRPRLLAPRAHRSTFLVNLAPDLLVTDSMILYFFIRIIIKDECIQRICDSPAIKALQRVFGVRSLYSNKTTL